MPAAETSKQPVEGRIIRLEVENFKSYNGRHTIGPFVNFTCVIGPNGAGKSNLMDAICFVLGLKAGQLRHKKLKDLIYTDGKKKGVVHKHAWVKLVYGEMNEEGHEVEHEFMRTVHQSGSSEYHMNGKVMGLEEYNKQLLKRNINVKARNFLVFQGDVALMAERDPQEVTQLIETICGSDTLKNEYAELEKKKKEAADKSITNFQRRKNMTNEKRHVKEQKEEAERYKNLEDELAMQLRQSALFRLKRIEDEINEGLEDRRENEEKLEAAAISENAAEQSVNEKKKEQARISKEIAARDKELNAARTEVEKRQPEYIKVVEQRKRLGKTIGELQKQEKEEKKKAEKASSEIKTMKKDYDDVCTEIEELEKDIEAANNRNNLQLIDEQITEYNQLKEQARAQTYRLNTQLQPIERKKKEEETNLENLTLRLKDAQIRKEQAESSVATIQDRISNLEERITSESAKMLEDKKSLKEHQKSNEILEKRQKELSNSIDVYTAKLQNARADQRASEREVKMNTALRKLKNDYPEVKGRFHELVSPVSQKYNTAVTVACGKSMDAIIVQDEKTAIDCIAYMKEQHIGTATFIPLDTIRVKPFDDSTRTLGGSKKLVADVLKYEPYLERAVQYAVGNTIVCDDIREAKELAFERRGNQRYRVVTLDGMLIEKNGLMTGGVGDNQKKAAKWDEKELDITKRKRDEAISELRHVQSKRKADKVEESLRAEITRVENALTFWKSDVKMSKVKLTKTQAELAKYDAEIEDITPKINSANAGIETLERKLATLNKDIHAVEDKTFAQFSKKVGVTNIREYEENTLRERKEQQERRQKLTAQRAKLKDKLDFLENRHKGGGVKEIASKIAQNEKEIAKLTEQLASMEEKKQASEQKVEDIQEAIRNLQRTRSDLDVEMTELKKSSAQAKKMSASIQNELASIDAKIEKCRSSRLSIYEECKVSEIAIPTVSVSESGKSNNKRKRGRGRQDDDEQESQSLSEAFMDAATEGTPIQIDFTEFEETINLSADPEHVMQKFSQKIRTIKEQLETLAPNLKAVEQFNALENQLAHTADEFDKARLAAKEAEHVFKECADRRHKLFMDAFNYIQGRIGDIYKQLTRNSSELTSSGTAELILENPDSPYLYGVKFQVMPPKKKYREMKELSGGEKTLAALALLFAIQEYNPSPFIVLDEIDAALDNENVGRVSRYIHEKANNEEAQCIVISLKDQFFERAEALVGICRDHASKSSSTLTIDLSQYAQ